MPLSWNDIRSRATAFSKEWENETNEDAEGKTFMDQFFKVFDIERRRFAKYEKRVEKLDGRDGYIDLLWPGMILIELKSRGKNLDKAHGQARDYFPGLKDAELPKYILVCDFQKFRLYDLIKDVEHEFELKDLQKKVALFAEVAGYKKLEVKEQDPINVDAVDMMGKLHDKLEAIGYKDHELEVYMVRILFCLFAEDSSVFDQGIFTEYILNKTKEDGSDLAAHLSQIFQVLNQPEDKRLKNIDDDLDQFPYVNGDLFSENLSIASFDAEMRDLLIDCCGLDWSKISPAIFGSMFQSIMGTEEQRKLGAHYTSEENILRAIKPLFLDELQSEFKSIKPSNKKALKEFHVKLSKLKFLDPACGCGNFLIIAYRELRLLELEVMKALFHNQYATGIESIMNINVDQFYGIEIEEWPAQIAKVALYLMDHQMNLLVSEAFGEYYRRLPLKKSPSIVIGNALELNWDAIISRHDLSYVLGNPPFIGSKKMDQKQREEVVGLMQNVKGSGTLDYVCGWYAKAGEYIQGTSIKVAFVSTNSIVQGEQVSTLWNYMINRFHIKIHFAHRTFKWNNEVKRGAKKAAVYCIIVGFAAFDTDKKYIYEYEDIRGKPHEVPANNVSPYLIDYKDLIIETRQNPICSVPKMSFGNMPLDGGHLIFTEEEKKDFLKTEPNALPYIRELIGAQEFLNGGHRYCLWLVGADPAKLRSLPEVMKRINAVKQFRLKSKAPSTQKFAANPGLFRDTNNPATFLIVPRVSSENRRYVPMGFFSNEKIAGDTCMTIPNGKKYHFGILNSEMHMAWLRTVCGRLKSDFRYSKDIVYNNYPWPLNPSDDQIKRIEACVDGILKSRKAHPNNSLADLYSDAMPPDLSKAHSELNKAVDACYKKTFATEMDRIKFLFELYEQYTGKLFNVAPVKKSRKKK